MREISISSQAIEDLLIRTHDLEDAHRSAVVARLRYLQRLGFPAAAVTGRGKKLLYGLEDALKIVVVFRYLEFSMSPVRAMRTVGMNWPHFSRALVQGWRAHVALVDKRRAEADGLAAIVAIIPSALRDVSSDAGRLDEQSPETVRIMLPSEMSEWAVGSACGPVQYIMIDPVMLISRLVPALIEICGVYDFEIAEAFKRIGRSAFSTANETEWKLTARPSGRPGGKAKG